MIISISGAKESGKDTVGKIIALFSDYIPVGGGRMISCERTASDGGYYTGTEYEPGVYPDWIITDTRFYNELQTIKDKGGICIRVNRESVETGDTHPSETEWRNWKFDYIINNNSNLPALAEEVRKMLIHFELL